MQATFTANEQSRYHNNKTENEHFGEDDRQMEEFTSEALDINSLRKMSLLLYRELMMMSISRETSAWNSNFSALLRSDLLEIDSASLQKKIQSVQLIKKHLINYCACSG